MGRSIRLRIALHGRLGATAVGWMRVVSLVCGAGRLPALKPVEHPAGLPAQRAERRAAEQAEPQIEARHETARHEEVCPECCARHHAEVRAKEHAHGRHGEAPDAAAEATAKAAARPPVETAIEVLVAAALRPRSREAGTQRPREAEEMRALERRHIVPAVVEPRIVWRLRWARRRGRCGGRRMSRPGGPARLASARRRIGALRACGVDVPQMTESPKGRRRMRG